MCSSMSAFASILKNWEIDLKTNSSVWQSRSGEEICINMANDVWIFLWIQQGCVVACLIQYGVPGIYACWSSPGIMQNHYQMVGCNY